MIYYLREHPGRALYRVETGTDRVEIWSDGWRLTALSVLQLDGLGGDAYYRVQPDDVERLKLTVT